MRRVRETWARRWIPIWLVVLASGLGLTASGAAAPVVTPARISVDASGASGTAGILVAGDEVVISWDNSASGDDNADVTALSQVEFDVFGVASLQADALVGDVFSVTYLFAEGDGELDGVTAGVTVTSSSGTTGPIYGVDPVDIDTVPPTVSVVHIDVDDSGASGAGGVFHPGDTLVVSWDNSVAGDANADVTDVYQVVFDLFGLVPAAAPDWVAGGVFYKSYTFSESDPELTGASIAVTVIDDAGNVTGPIYGAQGVDFSTSPPPSLPLLSPVGLWAAVLGLAAFGSWSLRARSGRSSSTS